MPGRTAHGRPSRGGSGAPSGQGPRDPARRAAYDVLRAVGERDAYANLALPSLLRERRITGRDAALATELTYGTLRNQGTYDAVLEVCIDRGLRSVDPDVLPLLRLGAHQLLATAIPDHAAVSATVDLARRVIGQRRSRFVNAVLRRVSRRSADQWLGALAPDRAVEPLAYLALRHSHPQWIVAALAEALGDGGDFAETDRLLAAHNERPGVTLLAKPGRATAADLLAEGAQPARYSPYGGYLPHGDPGDLPLVRQGRAAVADEASQLVALALTRARVAGDEAAWLDACAGPGGKAALLAGIAGGRGARLLAAELHPSRAALVRGAVARTPRDAARVVVADSTRPPWREGAFDRVLLDAPCTGLGALRRRPEARWRRAPESLTELVPLQRRLLHAALDSTRPGGVVAYVTCSPHLAETRQVVEAVRAQRPEVELLPAPDFLPGVPDTASGPQGRYAQLWPHRHGTDAMFLALMRR